MPHDPVFGPVIYSYDRADALADGALIDATQTAKEAGIRYPVALTVAVWAKYVVVPDGVACQDEDGRLWDIVWMLACAMRMRSTTGDTLLFKLHVRNTNRRGTPPLVTLKCVCGPVGMDDPTPCLTVMLPVED